MFHLLLIAAAAAQPLLHLDLDQDPQLPCPAHAALASRLEALDPSRLAHAPGADALEVALSWNLDHWQLRLLRGDRTPALQREFQLGRTDCALVAESAALVIDRYLAALREPPPARPSSHREALSPHRAASDAAAARNANVERDHRARASPPAHAADSVPQATVTPAQEPRPAPERIAPRAPIQRAEPTPSREFVATQTISPIVAAHTPVAASANAKSETVAMQPIAPPEPIERPAAPAVAPRDEPVPAAAAPFDRGALSVALGPAALVGLPSDLRAGAWLEVEHPISIFSTRALFLGGAPSSQAAFIDGMPRGTISAQMFLLALSAGPCVDSWVRACASLFAGARGTLGSSGGDQIYDQRRAFLVQPEFGAHVSIDRQLTARFQLRLALLAGLAPGTATLAIDGGSSRTLSTFDLAGALLLGYQLF